MDIKIEEVLNVYDLKLIALVRENAILTAEKSELMSQLLRLQKEAEDATKGIPESVTE